MSFPLTYRGEGLFEASSPYHRKRVDGLYGKGELIEVEVIEDRSPASHRHYFARVTELWQNLPEWLEGDFSNPTHLRKFALIRTGYCTKQTLVFHSDKMKSASKKAVEAADWISDLDPYVICEIVRTGYSAAVLTVWRAESQKMNKMKRHRFQQSKDDVLSFIECLLSSPPPKEVFPGYEPVPVKPEDIA